MARYTLHSSFYRSAAVLLAGCAVMLAQEPPPSGGWRRVGDPPPPAPADTLTQTQSADAFGQPAGQQPLSVDQAPPNYSAPQSLPPELTLAAGTYVTVRVDQMLSSDHNQPGDTFSATLMQPIVVDGIVVAQRGQTVYGRVAQAQKAKASQPSGLGLELTGLTLVDGTQVSVRTQLVGRRGGRTPTGEQVGTVATTTAVGAAVGAVADWGRGAAIGAGVGAAGGLLGVMLTRNHPTIVYPETALTFRIESPVRISTVRAPLAFRYVDPYEYDRPDPQLQSRPPAPRRIYGPMYGPVYDPYYGYYPYRWGPGVAIVVGGGWYRGGYWGRPVYRRWR